jgi:hypothetical protein
LRGFKKKINVFNEKPKKYRFLLQKFRLRQAVGRQPFGLAGACAPLARTLAIMIWLLSKPYFDMVVALTALLKS